VASLPPKKKEGKYTNWKLEANKLALEEAVKANLDGLPQPIQQLSYDSPVIIPDATLRHAVKEKKQRVSISTKGKNLDSVLAKRQAPESGKKSKSLTTHKNRTFLQNVAKVRDANNNGMTRSEMIAIIEEYCGASSWTQAEKHLD
jgi:hypothetical protein